MTHSSSFSPCDPAAEGTAACPFCGADYSHLRIMWGAASPSESHYYVTCFQCMAAGPTSISRQVALTRWNTAFAIFSDLKKKQA